MTWRSQAACHGITGLFFGEDQGEVKAAVAICRTCPVRDECLTWAIDTSARFGVLGGMTERQRREERSKRRRAGVARGVRPPAACGTESGYQRHRRLGQVQCGACRQANSRAQAVRDGKKTG